MNKQTWATKAVFMLLIILIPSCAETDDHGIDPDTQQAVEYLFSWGQFGTGAGEFHRPMHLTVSPTGLVFVVDHGNSRVQVFTSDGDYVREWGGFGSLPSQFVELTRFRGHFTTWEEGVHDAKITPPIPPGVSATDD